LSNTLVGKNRKNRKGKSKSNKGSLPYYAGKTQVFHPYSGPTIAPPMPHEFSVKLFYETFGSFVAGTTATVNSYGLMEFLGNDPGYRTYLYNLWKYCRVTRADMTVVIQSTGVPLKAALGWAPYADLATITSSLGTAFTTVAQSANSVRGSTGPSTGDTRLVLKRSYDPYELLGQFIPGKYYSMNAAQSIAASPIDTNEPFFILVIDSVDGVSNRSFTVEIRIAYHTQWHTLHQSDATS